MEKIEKFMQEIITIKSFTFQKQKEHVWTTTLKNGSQLELIYRFQKDQKNWSSFHKNTWTISNHFKEPTNAVEDTMKQLAMFSGDYK